MFGAQAWLTRDIIMDRIQLPSRADMEAANDQWREKEVAIRTDEEAFECQGDYISAASVSMQSGRARLMQAALAAPREA